MECLVTLCYPLTPPMPTESAKAIRPHRGKYWTYAGHLLGEDYSHVDKSLRTAIMRCQAHFPKHRPTLHLLERFLSAKIQREYPGESDDSIAGWLHKTLHDVSPQAPSSSNPAGAAEILGAGPGNPPVPVFYRKLPITSSTRE